VIDERVLFTGLNALSRVGGIRRILREGRSYTSRRALVQDESNISYKFKEMTKQRTIRKIFGGQVWNTGGAIFSTSKANAPH